ncbi:uncharacterized protein LOC135502445 [Lineus longissimus]|uniref:uncharacterized protein LOC135502445 n=1 Tax=Lineus longissimus TaxID=88925 RepID=UPI00315DCEFD
MLLVIVGLLCISQTDAFLFAKKKPRDTGTYVTKFVASKQECGQSFRRRWDNLHKIEFKRVYKLGDYFVCVKGMEDYDLPPSQGCMILKKGLLAKPKFGNYFYKPIKFIKSARKCRNWCASKLTCRAVNWFGKKDQYSCGYLLTQPQHGGYLKMHDNRVAVYVKDTRKCPIRQRTFKSKTKDFFHGMFG